MRKHTLIIGVIVGSFVSSGAFAQSSSSSLSSSSLSSTRSSSGFQAPTSSPSTGQLDWLNTRLSETRSPLIRSRLERDPRSPATGYRPPSSYMERRELLNRSSQEGMRTGDPSETDDPNAMVGYSVLEGLRPGVEGAMTDRGSLSTEPLGGEKPVQTNLGNAPTGRASPGTQQVGPRLGSQTRLDSQPAQTDSERLTNPMSGRLGYKSFEKLDENGEVIDDRLNPLLPLEEEDPTMAAEEDPEKAPVEDLLDERLPPSMVQPVVPAPPPSNYQLQTQKMWSQNPVRRPQTSQFGSGVAPNSVPFERSTVRNPGVYSGYQAPRVGTGANPNYSYQYRGPRLYSIGETEYETGSSYDSLPYYRR